MNLYKTKRLGIPFPADSNPADVYIEALGVDCDPEKEKESITRLMVCELLNYFQDWLKICLKINIFKILELL